METFTFDNHTYEMEHKDYLDIVTKILPNIFGVSLKNTITYGELYIIKYMLDNGWTLMPCFGEDEGTLYPVYNKFSKWCCDGLYCPVMYICEIDYEYDNVKLFSNGKLICNFSSFEYFKNHMSSIFKQPPVKCKEYFDLEIINDVKKFNETGFDDIYTRYADVYHNDMGSDIDFTYEIDKEKCYEVFIMSEEN